MKLTNKFQLIITFAILIALVFISYQLFLDNQAPKSKMDCLKLGSDTRAKACIELLEVSPSKKDFPIENIKLENMELNNPNSSYTKLTGTIENNFNLPADTIALRINFYKNSEQIPFHYEVFSPLRTSEQIQPYSKKTFSKRLESDDIIYGVSDLKYEIIPYGARIFDQ